MHRRQYRPDLKSDPRLGPPCTVAQEVEDVLALVRAVGQPVVLYGITVPTVLLGGDRNPPQIPERLDALSARMPHAERVVMRGRDHGADLKHPRDVARVIATMAERVFADG